MCDYWTQLVLLPATAKSSIHFHENIPTKLTTATEYFNSAGKHLPHMVGTYKEFSFAGTPEVLI